jgi:hypothetical protein
MNKSRKDLIDLCKENGIKGYTGKKKEEIVKLLTEENNPEEKKTKEKKTKEKKTKEKNPKEKKPKEKKTKEKTITQTHIELFKVLGNYNDEICQTRFVNVSEFTGDYADLKFGNGGGWSRFDGSFGKKYRVCTIKCDGKARYSRNCSEEDKIKMDKEIAKMNLPKNKGNHITFIKIIGIPETENTASRSIRSDIRAYIKTQRCVACGDSNVEVDHKNGLYNNPRVNSTATQMVSDFQALCKHCNDMKRQTYVWQQKNNQRYPATNIPMLAHFGIKYVEGDETFDPENPDAMIGTYWYDPVDFMKRLFTR